MEPPTSYAQHLAPLPTVPPAGEDICHLVEHLLLLPLYLTLPTSLFHPPPQPRNGRGAPHSPSIRTERGLPLHTETTLC